MLNLFYKPLDHTMPMIKSFHRKIRKLMEKRHRAIQFPELIRRSCFALQILNNRNNLQLRKALSAHYILRYSWVDLYMYVLIWLFKGDGG